MTQVSRPLIAVLLGAVVFFAVWTVALKPHPTTSGAGGSATGVGSSQSALDKAHQAVTTSDKASAAHGGTLPRNATTSTPARSTAITAAPAATTAPATTAPATTAPATTAPATTRAPATTAPATTAPATTRTPATTAPSTATATPVSAAQRRLSATESALDTDKVVALLFYNPAGADDRAVRQELDAAPTNGSKVLKLAVPLAEAGKYTFITTNVQLGTSPTIVLIDRAKRATTITGFADRFEIAQRIADALAAPAK